MSNLLSIRRAVVRHPKICVAASCPPPPPPVAWPPLIFTLQWIANWEWEEEAFDFNKYLDFESPPEWGIWEMDLVEGGNEWIGSLSLFPSTETADLTLDYTGDGDSCGCEKLAFPIVWGTPTLYAITTWDSKYPWSSIHEAHFTF